MSQFLTLDQARHIGIGLTLAEGTRTVRTAIWTAFLTWTIMNALLHLGATLNKTGWIIVTFLSTFLRLCVTVLETLDSQIIVTLKI